MARSAQEQEHNKHVSIQGEFVALFQGSFEQSKIYQFNSLSLNLTLILILSFKAYEKI